jgi:hypothetical protein
MCGEARDHVGRVGEGLADAGDERVVVHVTGLGAGEQVGGDDERHEGPPEPGEWVSSRDENRTEMPKCAHNHLARRSTPRRLWLRQVLEAMKIAVPSARDRGEREPLFRETSPRGRWTRSSARCSAGRAVRRATDCGSGWLPVLGVLREGQIVPAHRGDPVTTGASAEGDVPREELPLPDYDHLPIGSLQHRIRTDECQ